MEQVVIEFVGDTSKLREGLSSDLNQAKTEEEKSFQKVNKEAAAYAATMQRIEKAVTATGKAQGKSQQEIAKTVQQFKTLSTVISQGALEQVAQEAETVVNELSQMSAEMVKVTGQSKSMKAELRALKAELAAMEEAGQENSAAFTEMAVRAAQLEDQIGDTNARIKALASDTAVFDGLIGAVQGLAGGFAVVQGAAALFGDESEEVQQALLKVNAAMAILQGLQSIQLTLQKQSAASLLVQTTYQKAYNFVIDQTTGKLRLMNAAFALTGVGALVILIGALISNFDELRSALGFTTDATEGLNEALQQQDTYIKNLNDSFSQQERLLKALGASELELAQFKLQSAKAIAFAELAKLQTIQDSTKKQQEEVNKQIQTSTNLLVNLGILGGAASSLYNKLYGVDEGGERLKKTIEQQKEQQKVLNDSLIGIIEAESNLEKIQVKASEERVKKLREIDRKRFEGFEKITSIDKLNVDVDAIVASSTLSMEQKAAILRALGISPEEIEKAFRKGYEMVLAGTGNMTPVQIPVEVKPDYTQVQDAAIQAGELFASTIFNIAEQANRRRTETEINDINNKRDAEIERIQRIAQEEGISSEVLAQRKQMIADEAARKQAEIRKREFNANKQAAIAEAAIRFGLAQMQIAANISPSIQVGPVSVPNPAYIAAQIGAVSTLAASVAQIASQQPPAFAKGTKGSKVTPPGFKLVGEEGPELIYDGGGKKVITAPDTAKILSAYNIPALPDLSGAIALQDAAIGYAMPVIDYDKMAKAFSKEIDKRPTANITLDKNGITTVFQKGGKKITSLNNRFVV